MPSLDRWYFALGEQHLVQPAKTDSERVLKMGEATVESAFFLLQRGFIGSWHKISSKHLPTKNFPDSCMLAETRLEVYDSTAMPTVTLATPQPD